jgi:23S rRNA pseudouridine955/2504/2580 synthase
MTQASQTRPQEIEVEPGQEGQRIDNFLASRLKGVPKTRIYRILRKGEVRVNKGRIRPSYRLQVGDTVRIPPIRTASRQTPVRPPDRTLARIAESILYENERLLVIDKPSGIAVHGGSGISYGVIEALRALRPGAPFLELVHRLDRDTSGCLVIAKRRSTLRALHTLMREGGVEKRYLALLRGRWSGGARRVDAPLRKNVLRSGERIVRVSPDGKSALSLFRPVSIYAQASLVEVQLLTGRTHQVRVHAAHLGHPIAGDDKYGDADFNVAMTRLGLKRLFLHASSIGFTLPGGGEPVEVHAPLGPELRQTLDRLESAHGE